MHYLYILYSPQADKYYIGISSNVAVRLAQHLSGKSRFTSTYRDWKLVACCCYCSKTRAARMEHYLKKCKSRKRIEEFVAEFKLVNDQQ